MIPRPEEEEKKKTERRAARLHAHAHNASERSEVGVFLLKSGHIVFKSVAAVAYLDFSFWTCAKVTKNKREEWSFGIRLTWLTKKQIK